MAIFRVDKTRDYTVMSNHHLRDKNLTLKAKGLLSWMLSNTDEWDYSVAGIVAVMKENRDAINGALAELEDHGYLTRRKIRDGGKFGGIEYLIKEIPFTENPITVFPTTENPQQTSTNKTSTNKTKDHLPTVNEEQAPLSKKKPTDKEVSIRAIYEDPQNSNILDALKLYHSWYKDNQLGYKSSSVAKWASLLREYSKNDPLIALEVAKQSIANGWKNLYALKKQPKATAVSKKWNGETAKDEEGKEIVY